MGSAFHQLCPGDSGTQTPTAVWLWKTFTLPTDLVVLGLSPTGGEDFFNCLHTAFHYHPAIVLI